MKERFAPLAVAAAALLTNLTYYALTARDYLFPDSFTYLAPARSLLRGAGFVDATGAVETLRTPGYPLLLAAFAARIVPVVIAQHVVNAIVAAAIYWIAAPRLGRFIGVAAALLFAVDTPTIHYANKILTETFFTALLLVLFAMVLRRRALPAAGVLTGVLVLIRPVAIAYFAVVAVFLLLRRVRARDVAVYVVLAVALPFGWALRNYARTGVFTVSSIGSINLLSYRAAGVLAILDDGENFAADLADEQRDLNEDADDAIQRELHIPDAQELPTAVYARYLGRYAVHVIRQHPLALAELTLRGLMVNLFDSRWDAINIVCRLHESIVHIALDAFTAALFVFAVVGAIAYRRDDLVLLAAATVAYFLLISAGGESEARFRVPVMPQYTIAAAAGLDAVRRGAARRPR